MIPRVWNLSARLTVGILILVPIFVLLGLVLLAPPDGSDRAALMQFVGRFHPLSVHLPIALLVLVPLLELVGRRQRFSYLLLSIDFLLGIATCGAIIAAALGWTLARSGGYSGPLVTQHMWAGVFVGVGAWLCWVLRANGNSSGLKRGYVIALIATVALVSFAGYRGGQLSQGENHLTELTPEPLTRLLGLTLLADDAKNSPNGGPGTFYSARIQPALVGHCVTCHGRNRHKANLRLDSYDALMRGSKHGAVIKAGEPKNSELFHRITLPPTSDDFMPADNKRPLSASDVKLIELWISSGASGTLAADAIKDAPSLSSNRAIVAEVTFEEVDPAAVAKQRADVVPVLEQLQQRLPNVVDYQSRSSADVVVNASWMGLKFGDEQLAALLPLSERIVMADLSSTAITDRSADMIAKMKRLRSLRLMHTKITDTTVQALGPLEQLESVSIFDTPVTQAALSSLIHLPKLRRIYAGGTKISAEGPIPREITDKLVF